MSTNYEHLLKRLIYISASALWFLFIISGVISQPSIQWTQRYNSPYNSTDIGYKIATDNTGNIYLGGVVKHEINSYSYDFCIIKYNSAGILLWTQIYGSSGSLEYLNDIALDDSGNVYATGYKSNGNYYLPFFDFCTLKYDTNGILQWVQFYNGPGNNYDESRDITLDKQANVYITGTSVGTAGSTDYDYCTIKYNSDGIQQWIRRHSIGVNERDIAMLIVSDTFSNIYVTGSTGNVGTGSDCTTIKYNSAGEQQWIVSYDGTANWADLPASLKIDQLGNVYVAGGSDGTTISKDYFVIKYNELGSEIWVNRYDSPSHKDDYARSMVIDNALNVIVTGTSVGANSNMDFCTVKYNSNGAQQWVQRYNGPANNIDFANSLSIDSFNNIYACGYSFGTGTRYDFCILKYSPEGTQQWTERYNSSYNSDDFLEDFLLTGPTTFYAAGHSMGASNDDIFLVKYSQSIGIQYISSQLPREYSLSQNYPNPFNPVTKIRFNIPYNAFVKITVYDMTGKLISHLVDDELTAGTYETSWNAEQYSSGVYYYKLSAKGYSETKKMALIK